MQKPSWCFVVSTAYFMPAALAWRAHSRASNRSGSKYLKYLSYFASGIFSRFLIHSWRAGMEYRPQWMNMPKRSWVNHTVSPGDLRVT